MTGQPSPFPTAKAGLLAVLAAVIATVLWLSVDPSEPPPEAETPRRAGVLPDPMPAAADPATALPSAATTAVALAAAPTTAAPHEEHEFVIEKEGDAAKALALAIKAMGGAAKLEALRNATLRHYTLGSGVQYDGELLHQGSQAVLLTERDGSEQVGLGGDACWARTGLVVVRCTARQETLLRGLRGLHAATVLLPLQAPPFRLTRASVVEADGRRFNVLQFTVGQADEVHELYLDTNTHLPRRLLVSRQDRQSVRVDLDEELALGGAKVASLRRIGVIDPRGGPFEPFSDRVTEMHPGVDAARMKPPALTGDLPLRLGSRPPMRVASFLAGTRAGFDQAAQAIGRDVAKAEHETQFVVYEALGRPDSAASLDSGVELWVAQAELPPAAVGVTLVDVPAELKVAFRVRRLKAAEVIAAYLAFVAEVRAAGHEPGPGRPLIRYYGEPDATGTMTAEMQLPLATP